MPVCLCFQPCRPAPRLSFFRALTSSIDGRSGIFRPPGKNEPLSTGYKSWRKPSKRPNVVLVQKFGTQKNGDQRPCVVEHDAPAPSSVKQIAAQLDATARQFLAGVPPDLETVDDCCRGLSQFIECEAHGTASLWTKILWCLATVGRKTDTLALEAVCHHLVKEWRHIHSVHVSRIIFSLRKLQFPHDTLLELILRQASTSGLLGQQVQVSVVQLFATLQITGRHRESLLKTLMEIADKAAFLEGGDLASVMWSLARLAPDLVHESKGGHPSETRNEISDVMKQDRYPESVCNQALRDIVDRFVESSHEKIHSLDDIDLPKLLRSVAKLRASGIRRKNLCGKLGFTDGCDQLTKRLFHDAVSILLRRAFRLTEHSLASLLWAYATVGIFDFDLFELLGWATCDKQMNMPNPSFGAVYPKALQQASSKGISSFKWNEKNASNIFWSYGQARIKHVPLLHSFSSHITEKGANCITSMSPHFLSSFTRGIAVLRCLDKNSVFRHQLLQAVCSAFSHRLSEWKPPEWGNFVWSLALLGAYNPFIFFTTLSKFSYLAVYTETLDVTPGIFSGDGENGGQDLKKAAAANLVTSHVADMLLSQIYLSLLGWWYYLSRCSDKMLIIRHGPECPQAERQHSCLKASDQDSPKKRVSVDACKDHLGCLLARLRHRFSKSHGNFDSGTNICVSSVLQHQLKMRHRREFITEDGLVVDFLLDGEVGGKTAKGVVIEVQGPSHYNLVVQSGIEPFGTRPSYNHQAQNNSMESGRPSIPLPESISSGDKLKRLAHAKGAASRVNRFSYEVNGPTGYKTWLLQRAGYAVVHVPFYEWEGLTKSQQAEYLHLRLMSLREK